MPLIRSAHIGPSLVVTLAGYLLSRLLWPPTSALLIALAMFSGQLCIGWTNDLVDIESDRAEGRTNKPLAMGLITRKSVATASLLALTLCVPLSLLGPMGLRGGSAHLIGVASGLAYNYYFKSTWLSPLPFAIGFASLPIAICLGKNHFIPIWLVSAAALFGIAGHFANVVKDMEADRKAGLRGLPQILGTKASLALAGFSLLSISLILASHTHSWVEVPISAVAFILMFVTPSRFTFPLVMALALFDVTVLVSRISL